MLISKIQTHKFNLLFNLNLILTSLSVLLFTYSMLKFAQSELRFDDFGLFSFFPLNYFIAIFTLTISFIISLYIYPKSGYLLIFQTLELISFLFLAPLLVEGTPRFTSSFIIGGEIDYVLRNSFLDPELIGYHNWPGAEIFGATFILLTNSSLDVLLSFTPFISQIIYFFIVYSLFNKVFNNIKVWVSCWVFFISNWLNQDYFSPQNMAFFLYLIILFFLFKLVIENKHKMENKFNIIITFLALVTTHVLTPFILLLNMLFVTLINGMRKSNNKFLSLVFVLFIIYLSWEVYGAVFMFPKLIHSLIGAVDLELTREATENRISSGSSQHLYVVQFRIFNAFLLYLAALIGLISRFKEIKDVIPFTMILLITSTLGLFGAGGYGGEILIRIMLFSLIPLSYFIAQNYDNKLTKIVLIIFLIVSPFFHIIGHYGSETIDYTAPDDLKGANFFFAHAPLNDSSITCHFDELRAIKYIEKFKQYDFNSFTTGDDSGTQNNYIWLTRRSEKVVTFLEYNPKPYYETVSSLNLDPLYNKIYSSKNFKVYLET